MPAVSCQPARPAICNSGFGRGVRERAATRLHPTVSAREPSQQACVSSSPPAALRPLAAAGPAPWSALVALRRRRRSSGVGVGGRRVRGRRLLALAPRACAIGGHACGVAARWVAASRHDELHPRHDVAATRPLRDGLRDGLQLEAATYYATVYYSLRCTYCLPA